MINIIYREGHTVIPIRNIADTYTTLTIGSSCAGGCATGTIAPRTTDRSVGYRCMRCIVYGDGHSGSPLAALAGACPIQVADMEDSGRWC